MRKEEIEGFEKYQRLANGIAATLMIAGFSLLLTALILALQTENGESEEHAAKTWQEGGRMSVRTRSRPLLRTDDDSDATITTMANL